MSSRPKALLLENIHAQAADILQQSGYDVESWPQSLSEAELIHKLSDVTVLGTRSNTHVTPAVIKAAPQLAVIGAFCVGTNQIDLATCSQSGVAVFNAPYSNTRSVAELAIGEIIMLMRRAFDKSMAMHAGTWNKSAAGSHEIRGKKLGIIGYGNIGSQISIMAESLGMEVYFYDIADRLALGNAKKVGSLEELLKLSDAITVHVDGQKTQDLISAPQLNLMKPGAIILNLSRGFVVNTQALAGALKNGHIGGAGIDVFTEHPDGNNVPFKTPLQGLPNVILTPHIGGSTGEAQYQAAAFVANKIARFMGEGNTSFSVNFPAIQVPPPNGSYRLIHIHQNIPGVLAKIGTAMANSGLNIERQLLGTNQAIGYVVIDAHKPYSKELVQSLTTLAGTIKVRVLK